MIGLQELIYRIDAGEGSRLIKLAAILLGLLALTILYDLREYRCFNTQEAMDQAQLARNLAEGKGFTTQFVRPLSLHLVTKQLGDQKSLLKEGHPDLANPPVYPLVLAGLMKVLPFNFEMPNEKTFERYQPEMIITVFNQALFFLAVWMIFGIAQRLFNDAVAWLTAILVAGCDVFWRFSVSGLSTLLLLVILLGVIRCLLRIERGLREEQHSGRWFLLWAIGIGVLLGVGGLTRYSFGWLILPTAAFLAIYAEGPKRWTLPLAMLLAFGLVLTPWLYRNYQLSGTCFGTAGYAVIHDMPRLTGAMIDRTLNPDLSPVPLDFSDYSRKLLVNLQGILRDELPRLGGSWVVAFFLAGLLIKFNNPALTRLRLWAVLSLITTSVAQALGRTYMSTEVLEINSENQLVLFAPLVFAFGVGLFFVLLEQMDLPTPPLRYAVTTVFGLIACAPLIFTLLPPRSHPVSYPPYFPPWIQESAGFLKSHELIMSDVPWAVAWYGNRQSVWLTFSTNSKGDFFAINDYLKPINALYLTQTTMDGRFQTDLIQGPNKAWGKFLLELGAGKVPTGFPLKNIWLNLFPHQIFLADWERWNKPNPSP